MYISILIGLIEETFLKEIDIEIQLSPLINSDDIQVLSQNNESFNDDNLFILLVYCFIDDKNVIAVETCYVCRSMFMQSSCE